MTGKWKVMPAALLMLLSPLLMHASWVFAQDAGKVDSKETKTEVTSWDEVPVLAVAVVLNDRTIGVYRVVKRMVTETRTQKTQTQNGTEWKTYTTEVPIWETHLTQFDIDKIAVQRVDGSSISRKDVMARLATRMPVVFLERSEQIDPFFAKMFLPETLVLSLPAPVDELPDEL